MQKTQRSFVGVDVMRRASEEKKSQNTIEWLDKYGQKKMHQELDS
jgi:hypothetical protein